MKEVEIPRTYISGQADSVMMLTEDVPSERMLAGDMVLMKQLHGNEDAIKDGHLYAVTVDTKDGNGIKTRLYRIKPLEGRKVSLYLKGFTSTVSLDDIYIKGEILGFQSLVVSPEEVLNERPDNALIEED